MRIIVDEIPKEPIDCLYSEVRKRNEHHWIVCTKGDFVCKDTKQCKYLVALDEIKKKEKNRGDE